MSTTPPPPGCSSFLPSTAASQPTLGDPHAMTLTADEREHVMAVTEAYADALADAAGH